MPDRSGVTPLGDRDRDRMVAFFRRDLPLHIYALGDLDPFFWPHTRWWGLQRAGRLEAVALLYHGAEPPTLLALGRNDSGATGDLLEAIRDELPASVYAHLSPGLADVLAPRFAAEPHGLHHKMLLRDPARVRDVDTHDVRTLTVDDLPALQALYARAYPGNWFDARMLATNRYVGIVQNAALVCVAGVHVWAPGHGVAALGNVTTDPTLRGRGLATRTTARLCTMLEDDGITAIGLNVLASNASAIRCYERLGFTIEASYDELMLTAHA